MQKASKVRIKFQILMLAGIKNGRTSAANPFDAVNHILDGFHAKSISFKPFIDFISTQLCFLPDIQVQRRSTQSTSDYMSTDNVAIIRSCP